MRMPLRPRPAGHGATAAGCSEGPDEPACLADEQAALRRVATLLEEAAPAEELFGAVAAEVGRLVGANFTVLSRYETDEAHHVVGAWSSAGDKVPLPVGTRVPLAGRNAATLVFESGRPAPIDDYDDTSGPVADVARSFGARQSTAVPIHVDGHLWGVLVAASYARPLPPDAEARLAGFTELVGTAVANAHARVVLRAFAEEQAALRRVATLVARAAPPEEVFVSVTEEVGRALSVGTTILDRYDADGGVTIVGTWSESGTPMVPVGHRLAPGGENLHSVVFRTGRSARIDDYTDATGAAADAARRLGVRSAVGSPVTVEGRLWGFMSALSTGDPLPADAEARLAGFTELVGTAIANAQARLELRAFAEEQGALRRVAVLVAQAAPPEQVFAAVTAEVGQLLDVDFSVTGRYDTDGGATILGIWTRTGEPAPLSIDRVELGGANVTTRVFETGRPARLDSYAEASGAAADVGRTWGLRSLVGVPISVDDRIWGFVIVATSHDDPLPTDTEARLAGFTELVGTAIANAETQAALTASRARIVAASDATRRRIERDLHDAARQRLVSLALHLRSSVQAGVPPGADALTALLEGVAAELVNVVEELHELAMGVHPAALTEGGLPAALQTLARRCAVEVRLDVDVERRLTQPVELAAYYVVAEALTNAVKHAHATAVDVQASVDERLLRVRVRDNGCGGADSAGGSGLVGLTDRVEALGGRFFLTSPPGVGTAIQVLLPLG